MESCHVQNQGDASQSLFFTKTSLLLYRKRNKKVKEKVTNEKCMWIKDQCINSHRQGFSSLKPDCYKIILNILGDFISL